MMSAYIRQLQRFVEAQSPPGSRKENLRSKFEKWFASLPAPTRNRPFSMNEFERALGTSGRFISPILLELNWRRKRIWATKEHYHRFWVPPPK
jgi:hypothetical protein